MVKLKKNYNPILPSTFRALGWNVGQGTLQTLLQPVRPRVSTGLLRFDQLLLASSEGCGLHLRMRTILTGTRLYYILHAVFTMLCNICGLSVVIINQNFFYLALIAL